jgi:hypothetical protein
VSGIYEKVFALSPFNIAHAIAAQDGREIIAILREFHTSCDWPPETWPR